MDEPLTLAMGGPAMADPRQLEEFPVARAGANAWRAGDLSLFLDGQLVQLTSDVFVGDERLLEVSFTAARARLANLIRGGLLVTASNDAYNGEITGLARVGPLGSAPAMSRLVEVHFQELKAGDSWARLALRWQVAGPGGELFPALDADITLTPAGEHVTVLRLAGAYRPPLGSLGASLDRAILHRVAEATIRAFTSRIATAIVHPASATEPGTEAAGLNLPPLPEPETP